MDQANEIKFCPFCGAEKESAGNFCHNCGKALSKPDKSDKPVAGLYGLMAGFVVIGSLLVFAFVKLVILKPDADDHHHHDHSAAVGGVVDDGSDPRLTQLLAHARTGDAKALLDLAEYQIEKSNGQEPYLRQAASTLEQVLVGYPDHAYVLRLLGHIYYQLRNPEHAALYYEKYLALQPKDANVITDLGTQYVAMGRFEHALILYKRAVTLFPDHYHAHYNQYVAYREMGDEAAAAKAKEAAEGVDRRVGKKLAPEVVVARVPEGPPRNVTTVAGTASRPAAKAPSQAEQAYAGLRQYFATHQIVGPKMTGFKVVDEGAVLEVRRFPMAAMPPFARETFDRKVNEQLNAMGKAKLTIKDADSGEVLARYAVP